MARGGTRRGYHPAPAGDKTGLMGIGAHLQNQQNGFHEAWYLKLNDPNGQKALWLRLALLSSKNGFRRLAEAWAVFSERRDNKEFFKTALKQSHEMKSFSIKESGVQLGECELNTKLSRGTIYSKGHTICWDLSLTQTQPLNFNLMPESLQRLGLIKNKALTLSEDLRINGTTEINGEKHTWNSAHGMQGQGSGSKFGHSWVWGHCNTFVNEHGKEAPAIFEGLTSRAKLVGPLVLPKLSSFFFFYQGRAYRFNSLWDCLRIRSRNNLTEWNFVVDRGDLAFRGILKAEHREFAGLTYEDTDGSLLYCNCSSLSNMTLLVYRRGKLETTLNARGTATFEIASRIKNPYVPLLV